MREGGSAPLLPLADRAVYAASEAQLAKEIGEMLDWLIALLDRRRLAITLVTALWFWTSTAIYAGFVALPALPETVTTAFFWSSVAANAGWWGFLNPKIEARRKELANEDA